LLSVRVKEPVGSGLDNRANKFGTACSLSVLVRHKYGVVSAANAVRNRQSLIILRLFNHLELFVRVGGDSGGRLLLNIIVIHTTGSLRSRSFMFRHSLLSHGNSESNESLLVGVRLVNNGDLFISTLSVLSFSQARGFLHDYTFRNLSELNFFVNIIDFEALLLLLHLLDDVLRDLSGYDHEDGIEDQVDSLSVLITLEGRVVKSLLTEVVAEFLLLGLLELGEINALREVSLISRVNRLLLSLLLLGLVLEGGKNLSELRLLEDNNIRLEVTEEVNEER
jgi:hypothetical protein